jgi:Flp pilus assembly protein CpaB
VELEYSDRNSRRSKIYIAVGIIVALLVAATVFVALQASGITAREDVEMRQVVVAATDIAGRATVAEADVVMREVPADPVNETAFTSLDEVVGRVVAVPVGAGQLMAPNLLASTEEGATFSILEPGQEYDPAMPDLRAVSVTVPDERAVAGTLVAGQRVDLIATVTVTPIDPEGEEAEPQEPGDPLAGPSTKTTLQHLDILSRNGTQYILRSDLGTSEKIAELVAAGAQFTFVLRADIDDRIAETEGSTLDQLLEEFEFPMPEVAELE